MDAPGILALGLKWLRLAEGGHANHPKDPGGDTWFGIARTFHLDEEPWPPSLERAEQILTEEYWRPVWAGLPPRLGLALFDASVNQGPITAVLDLQKSLGGLKQDGVVGPATLTRARTLGPLALDLFLGNRAYSYSWVGLDFRRGLMNRLFRLRSYLEREIPDEWLAETDATIRAAPLVALLPDAPAGAALDLEEIHG